MRLASFVHDGRPGYGVVDPAAPGSVADVSAVLGDELPDLRSVLAAGALERVAEAAGRALVLGAADVRWLPPVTEPRRIL